MKENRFWELVDIADWPNRDMDDVKQEYMSLLSEQEADAFGVMASGFSSQIDHFIGPDRNPAGGGDDSHWDLCNHIVGLGKEQYYKHLADYTLIEETAKNYEECFSYCIPYDWDYKEKEGGIEQFSKEAKRCLKENVRRYMGMDNKGDLNPLSQDFNNVTMALGCLSNDNVDFFLHNKDDVLKSNKKIGKFFKDNRLELPRKFTENLPNGSSGGYCPHWLDNLYSDVEKWLKYNGEKNETK